MAEVVTVGTAVVDVTAIVSVFNSWLTINFLSLLASIVISSTSSLNFDFGFNFLRLSLSNKSSVETSTSGFSFFRRRLRSISRCTTNLTFCALSRGFRDLSGQMVSAKEKEKRRQIKKSDVKK
jgi:hypothetical protein